MSHLCGGTDAGNSPADRDACARADESPLRSCTRLLAVGDGSPCDDRDPTARLVARARAIGVDVEVHWPD
ncbi:hypothetical protein [Streptomyces acidiscabies]|uniref:hypothetical protein n=1 Tax=Streptomyces acidiscabies TaxID=42234 RepID=UPI000AAF29EF|nr:hypothetical protein [Streptomyces acidiscabies]